jgi:hypothetical protein
MTYPPQRAQPIHHRLRPSLHELLQNERPSARDTGGENARPPAGRRERRTIRLREEKNPQPSPVTVWLAPITFATTVHTDDSYEVVGAHMRSDCAALTISLYCVGAWLSTQAESRTGLRRSCLTVGLESAYNQSVDAGDDGRGLGCNRNRTTLCKGRLKVQSGREAFLCPHYCARGAERRFARDGQPQPLLAD